MPDSAATLPAPYVGLVDDAAIFPPGNSPLDAAVAAWQQRRDEPWAALGTRLAADLYDCTVLEDGVEDQAENETRFVWLEKGSPGGFAAGRPSLKTSIVFWGLSDSPGALVEVLQEFASRGVNLSKIESRPRKQGLGRYIFFADLEGGAADPSIAGALTAVEQNVERLRILGCYLAAQ